MTFQMLHIAVQLFFQKTNSINKTYKQHEGYSPIDCSYENLKIIIL